MGTGIVDRRDSLLRAVGVRRVAVALCAMLQLCHVTPCFAQSRLDLVELLETSFSSATLSAQPLEATPASVHVITRKEIETRGHRTIADALRTVTGFVVLDDLTFENIGVRGVYASQRSPNEIIKLMINGQPVSFRPLSGTFFGQELIPIEAVDRIEVIRGPAAAIYGANAFLAVVNVLTRKPQRAAAGRHNTSIFLGGKYRSAGAPHFGASASLMHAAAHEDLSYLVSASVDADNSSNLKVPGASDIEREVESPTDRARGYPSPGWDPVIRQRMARLGLKTRGSRERSASVFGQVQYQLAPEQTLSLQALWQSVRRPEEFRDYSVLSHLSRQSFQTGQSWISYALGNASRGLSLDSQVGLGFARPSEGDKLVDSSAEESYAERHYSSVFLDGRLLVRYSNSHHELSLGVDYTVDREKLLELRWRDTRTGETIDHATSLDSQGREQTSRVFANIGPHAQWLWRPLPFLTAIAGSRLDANNLIRCSSEQWDCLGSSQLSARLGLVATSERLGYVKLLYGSSYKPPSPGLLYSPPLSVTDIMGGDAALRPQTADTWEVLWGYGATRRGRIEIGGYYTEIDDLVLSLKGRTGAESRNAHARFAGGEVSLRKQLSPDLDVSLGVGVVAFSEIEPRRRLGETQAAWELQPSNDRIRHGRYPDWSSSLALDYLAAPYHLGFRLSGQFLGERRASLQNNELFQGSDFSDTYRFGSQARLQAQVNSHRLFLFDHKNETRISLSLRFKLGDTDEPGVGGVDIPERGPRLFAGLRQWF